MRRRKLKELTKLELEELSRAEKTSKDPKVRKRSQALLLMYKKGKGMVEIIDIFSIDRDTLSRWITRYESEGIDGLKDRFRSGRPVSNKEKLIKKS